MGVRRIGLQQIAGALAQLEAAPMATAVHETRKSLKRLRALLRLVRPGVTEAAYARESERLRDIGRCLSGSRDATVLRQTLQHLGEASPTIRRSANAVLANLKRQDKSAVLTDQHPQTPSPVETAIKGLQDAAERWRSLELEPDMFETLAEGMSRGYRRCKRAYDAAYDEGTDAAFHDWRKTVQVYWRHMRLLEAAWPDYYVCRAAEAKTISELLGSAQDLALVTVCLQSGRDLKSKMRTALLTLATVRQSELRAQARPLAQRLLAEGVGGHQRRTELNWKAAGRIDEAAHARATAGSGQVVDGTTRTTPAKPRSKKATKADAATRARTLAQRARLAKRSSKRTLVR